VSLSTTITYDTAGNFTFNAAKIEITGGLAQLVLGSAAATFTETFDSDTGFTYDSAKAEFTGGQVQQSDQVPDTTFVALFTADGDGDWGDGTLTVTETGSPTYAGGQADLTTGTSYLDWPAAGNADHVNIITIRYRWEPQYTGTPATSQVGPIITKATGDADNLIGVSHQAPSGQIRINCWDAVGGVNNFDQGAWSPTSGVEYEFELNLDFDSDVGRFFIDGTQFGADIGLTGITRDSSIGLFRFGSGTNGSFANNFKLSDLAVFDTIQHTANYTPASLPANRYLSSTIDLPQFVDPGPGQILTFTGATSSESGSQVRYQLSLDSGTTFKYWNSGGGTWDTSDGTYAQSSTMTEVNTNIPALTIPASTQTVDVRSRVPDTNTQAAIANLTIDHTANTTYDATDPDIIVNSGFSSDALETFASTLSETGSDAVTFVLNVDGTDKYWSGTAWVTSTGVAQSNTAADINTNMATLDISSGATIKLRAYLHSDDGSTTPTLTDATATYDFFVSSPTAPTECIVYGFVKDKQGNAVDGATVLWTQDAFYTASNNILAEDTELTTDSDGRWEISVVESASVSGTPYHVTIYGPTIETTQYRDLSVPNETTKDFKDIV